MITLGIKRSTTIFTMDRFSFPYSGQVPSQTLFQVEYGRNQEVYNIEVLSENSSYIEQLSRENLKNVLEDTLDWLASSKDKSLIYNRFFQILLNSDNKCVLLALINNGEFTKIVKEQNVKIFEDTLKQIKKHIELEAFKEFLLLIKKDILVQIDSKLKLKRSYLYEDGKPIFKEEELIDFVKGALKQELASIMQEILLINDFSDAFLAALKQNQYSKLRSIQTAFYESALNWNKVIENILCNLQPSKDYQEGLIGVAKYLERHTFSCEYRRFLIDSGVSENELISTYNLRNLFPDMSNFKYTRAQARYEKDRAERARFQAEYLIKEHRYDELISFCEKFSLYSSDIENLFQNNRGVFFENNKLWNWLPEHDKYEKERKKYFFEQRKFNLLSDEEMAYQILFHNEIVTRSLLDMLRSPAGEKEQLANDIVRAANSDTPPNEKWNTIYSKIREFIKEEASKGYISANFLFAPCDKCGTDSDEYEYYCDGKLWGEDKLFCFSHKGRCSSITHSIRFQGGTLFSVFAKTGITPFDFTGKEIKIIVKENNLCKEILKDVNYYICGAINKHNRFYERLKCSFCGEHLIAPDSVSNGGSKYARALHSCPHAEEDHRHDKDIYLNDCDNCERPIDSRVNKIYSEYTFVPGGTNHPRLCIYCGSPDFDTCPECGKKYPEYVMIEENWYTGEKKRTRKRKCPSCGHIIYTLGRDEKWSKPSDKKEYIQRFKEKSKLQYTPARQDLEADDSRYTSPSQGEVPRLQVHTEE